MEKNTHATIRYIQTEEIHKSKKLEVVLNSFVYLKFNYRPLSWHFSTKKSVEKIENMLQRCLRFTFND